MKIGIEESKIENFFIVSVFVVFVICYCMLYFQFILSNNLRERISDVLTEDLSNYDIESYISATRMASFRNYQLALIIADTYVEKINAREMSNSENSEKNVDIGRNTTDKNKAINFYEMAINGNPVSAESHIKLGELYFRENNYQKAISSFKIAAELDGKNAYTLFTIADYFFKMGLINDGKSILRIACNIVDGLLPEGLRIMYEVTGKVEDLYVITPRNKVSLMSMGSFLRMNKMYDEAIKVYKDVLNIDSHDQFVYAALVNVYTDMGDIDKTLSVWEESVKANPENPDALYGLGLAYQKIGNVSLAVENINKAVKLADKNTPKINIVNYHLVLMNIYFRMGEYEKCIKETEEIISIDYKSAKAYYFKGLCEQKIKNDLRAVVLSFKKAEELEPEEIQYKITLANCYKDYGLYKSAVLEWKKIALVKGYERKAATEISELMQSLQNSNVTAEDKGLF
ncbi:MAG: tetratricopeptide repeat protein [Candidatus Schekmanbacteria bacterium]|nr:tetratricopeptide repeat protein [Candidatus Schekmanbacteria bacterium]